MKTKRLRSDLIEVFEILKRFVNLDSSLISDLCDINNWLNQDVVCREGNIHSDLWNSVDNNLVLRESIN
jgi:hypothetical protein